MCSVCGLSPLLITDAQEVVEKSYWVSVGGGEIIYWGQNRRTDSDPGNVNPERPPVPEISDVEEGEGKPASRVLWDTPRGR